MGGKDETIVQAYGSATQDGKNLTTIAERYADQTLRIIEDHGDEFGPLTPEKEMKLRRKLYWHVMGLLSAINLLLFVRHRRGSEERFLLTDGPSRSTSLL